MLTSTDGKFNREELRTKCEVKKTTISNSFEKFHCEGQQRNEAVTGERVVGEGGVVLKAAKSREVQCE